MNLGCGRQPEFYRQQQVKWTAGELERAIKQTDPGATALSANSIASYRTAKRTLHRDAFETLLATFETVREVPLKAKAQPTLEEEGWIRLLNDERTAAAAEFKRAYNDFESLVARRAEDTKKDPKECCRY
jgi:hypothetical protein